MHTGTYGMINNNFFINPKIQKGKTKIAIEHANIVGLERSNVTFFYDFISVVCLLLAIALVTLQTIKGDILVGSLLLAFTTYRSFTAVVQDFYANITRMEDQSRYSKRWFDVFDTKPKILNSKNAIRPDWQTPPVIEFKNVSYSYKNSPQVLNKIDLIIEKNQTSDQGQSGRVE